MDLLIPVGLMVLGAIIKTIADNYTRNESDKNRDRLDVTFLLHKVISDRSMVQMFNRAFENDEDYVVLTEHLDHAFNYEDLNFKYPFLLHLDDDILEDYFNGMKDTMMLLRSMEAWMKRTIKTNDTFEGTRKAQKDWLEKNSQNVVDRLTKFTDVLSSIKVSLYETKKQH